MSEQVQSIINAVRRLDAEQFRELTTALAALEGAARPLVAGSRKQLVDEIRGKYRYVPTSSEAFMDRKREETAREMRT